MSIARHPLIMFATKPAAASSFLLDTYTGAAAAYSLRQLKTGVTSVVRVRRSSDAAEADFTATEITNGTLTTWIGANNGFVVKWYDQSGNSNDATQTTTASQPKIYDSATGVVTDPDTGKPSILYPTADPKGFSLPSAVTIKYVTSVYNISSLAFLNYIFGGGTGNLAAMGTFQDVNGLTIADGGALLALSSPETTHVANIASYYQASARHYLGTNGGAYVNVGAVTNDLQISVIGNSTYTATGNLNGYLSELIGYTTEQSTNRTGIETNINDYYNVY